MLVNESQPLVHEEVEAALRALALLLHMFAIALLACIAAAAAFSLYWVFSDTLSTYRRQLNAKAHNAQLFFDQRESLLRSLAAFAIRNSEGPGLDDWPSHLGNAQIDLVPLEEGTNNDGLALILTSIVLSDIARFNTRLVYISFRRERTTNLAPLPRHEDDVRGLTKHRWITDALVAASAEIQAGGDPPITWLVSPLNKKQLYLFMPMEPGMPMSGWIGLEVSDIDVVFDLSSPVGGGYALLDDHDTPILLSTQVPFQGQQHSFEWPGGGLWPQFIVLNKSIGQAGWRLTYQIRVSSVLAEMSLAITLTLAAVVLLFAAVIQCVRHLKKTLVVPATRSYEALSGRLTLVEQMVDVAPVGLCLLRRVDGVPIRVNELARQWLVGNPSFLSQRRIEDELDSGREYMLQDGRWVYVTWASIVYRGQERILCCINDITTFKQVEHAITSAKHDAEVANRAKTLFLTTMSHEIRTPLFGILGTLEVLGLTTVDTQQRQYLETMWQSSSTLLRTINHTLDLSRIEAGHLELECSKFHPVKLLEAVVSGYAARAESKGLHIYSMADVNTPAAVLGDSTRTRQILDNLVSNAIKFTDSGQIVLRVNAERRGTQSVTLKFQVSDTGVGIASEHLSQLFEPYYRAESGVVPAAPGTGLGLAICARLSDTMGGKLAAVSEPGLGTSMSFELTLPLAGEDNEEELTQLTHIRVFVRGALNDVVNNLCHWLRRWGALAMPYRDADHRHLVAGVLVDAWPCVANPAPWAGARVVARPPGTGPRLDETRGSWVANAYSLDSIAHAVRQAHDGLTPEESLELSAVRDTLDMHLLVVEDNLVSQRVLREQLEYLGCSVALATNGQEALSRSDIPTFDAVLTDLQMPHIDGYALARELRSQGYAHPIVGITACAFAVDMRQSAGAGLSTVLLKPLPIAALRQALAALKEVP